MTAITRIVRGIGMFLWTLVLLAVVVCLIPISWPFLLVGAVNLEMYVLGIDEQSAFVGTVVVLGAFIVSYLIWDLGKDYD